jgi:outer membrane protein with beta-barrel domain
LRKIISARRVHAIRHAWRILAMAATTLVACAAHAQTTPLPDKESSITLYGGYRGGGSLTDESTGMSMNVHSDPSYAIAVDIGVDHQTQIQLFYGHQDTALSSEIFAPTVNNFGLSLDYFHVGGSYFFEEVGTGVYVVAGIGATHARPDRDDLNSETFLSANIGAGYMLPLGKHVGLRFEARGYGTLIRNESSLFCGNNAGCIATIHGDALYQGEALAGLSIRF